jgi:hypothetical protein
MKRHVKVNSQDDPPEPRNSSDLHNSMNRHEISAQVAEDCRESLPPLHLH